MEKKKTNNPNGRPKGTPNRITGELRERIYDFLERKFEGIEFDFEKLEAKEKAQVFVKLLEYVIPKQTHSNINATLNREEENQSPVTIFLLPDNNR